MVVDLPKKLKVDAIVEAVLELRFEPDPHAIVELLIGRLADTERWKSFNQVRLPVADVPSALRQADPNLRYQPLFQLVARDGSVFIAIGSNVLVFSRRGKYPGWDVFGPELNAATDRLYEILPSAKVSRIGLRYINALLSTAHQINSVADLDLDIKVAKKALTKNVNLNYKDENKNGLEIMTRVASVDIAEGAVPENATVIVDIDVYTRNGYAASDAATVKQCIKDAHDAEKLSFFGLLGTAATERLKQN